MDRAEEHLTRIQGKYCRYERPCLLASLPTSLLYDHISGNLMGIDGIGRSLRLDVSLGLADHLDELATGTSATHVMNVREGRRQKGRLRVTYDVLNLGHFGFGDGMNGLCTEQLMLKVLMSLKRISGE